MRQFAFAAALIFAAAPSTLAQTADPARAEAGEQIYETYCVACHGEKLRNSGQSFDLRGLKGEERERFDKAVRNGRGQMPPWLGVLSDEEIDQVWHFIRANAFDK